MEVNYDLIGAGDAESKENRQEEVSCEQRVDALSEAHVDECKAEAKSLSGDAQNLDGGHKAGTE